MLGRELENGWIIILEGARNKEWSDLNVGKEFIGLGGQKAFFKYEKILKKEEVF